MIKRFWQDLCRWFAYFKVMRRTYDFDYASLLEVELHQLTALRNCIAKYQSHVNSWYDIRNMDWAISCLKIVVEDGCSYSNGAKAFLEKELDSGEVELIPNPDHKFIMPIYVNTQNGKRFCEFCGDFQDALIKDILRIKKAWYLYNRIRQEHLKEWWD